MARHRVRMIGAAAAVMAAAAGCAPRTAGKSPAPAPQPATVTSRYTTHAFMGECVFVPDAVEAGTGTGEFAGVLLGAVLPSLISHGLNLIGGTLEAAGKEHTWQATASANFEATEPGIGSCVQVVRGRFALTAADDTLEWAVSSARFRPVAADLRRAGILLDAPPDFFFEGRIRAASAPEGVFAIAPVAAAFTAPMDARALRGDARNVMLTFAFHPPGKSATDAASPSTRIVLGELEPGAWIEFDTACSAPAPPPAQPGGEPGAPSPSTAPGRSRVARCADEGAWFRLPRGKGETPMTMTAIVSEVQGKAAFMAFLADVFKGSKAALDKLATVALIESESEKARLASVQASIESSSAADKALTAAIVALEACSETGSAAKTGDALVKQQAANLAAEQAGRGQPFAAPIKLGATGDANKARCAEALAPYKDGGLAP